MEFKPELTANSVYRVIQGKDANLMCTVDANPIVKPENVEWLKKEGLVSKPNGTTLRLTSVARSDAAAHFKRSSRPLQAA